MAVQHSSSPEKLHDKLQRLSDSELQKVIEGGSSYAATIALGILQGRVEFRNRARARSHDPNPETVADAVIAKTDGSADVSAGVPVLPVELDVPPEVASNIPRGINAPRAAPTDTNRFMRKGVVGLPSPNMTYAAQGGIVNFAEGGSAEESVPSPSFLNAVRKAKEQRMEEEQEEQEAARREEDRLGPAIRRAAQRRDQEQHLKAIKERFPELYKILTEEKAQGGIVNLRSGGSLRWKEGLQPPDSIMDFWNRLLTYTGMGEDEEEERKAGERAAGTSRPPTTGDLRRAAEAERLKRSVIDEEAVPDTPPTPGVTPRWKEGLQPPASIKGLWDLLTYTGMEKDEEERKATPHPKPLDQLRRERDKRRVPIIQVPEEAGGPVLAVQGTSLPSPPTTGDLRRAAEAERLKRSVIDEEAVPDTPPGATGPQKSGIARVAELLRESKIAEREAGRRAGIPVPEEAGGAVLDASSGATSDSTPLSALNPNDPRLSILNRAVELFKPDQQQRVQQEAQAARLRELKERFERDQQRRAQQAAAEEMAAGAPLGSSESPIQPSPLPIGGLVEGLGKTYKFLQQVQSKRAGPMGRDWDKWTFLPQGRVAVTRDKDAEREAGRRAEEMAGGAPSRSPEPSTQPLAQLEEIMLAAARARDEAIEKRNKTNAEVEAARAREPKPKPKPKSPEPKPPVAGARAEVGAKKATEQTTQTKQDYTEQDYSDINKLVGKGAERFDSLSDESKKSLQTTAEAKGISPIRLALILGGLKLMSGESLGDAAEKAVAAYAAAEKYQYDRSVKAYEKARLAEDRRRTAEYREETIKLRKEEAKNRQARAEATEKGRQARAKAAAKNRAETSARQQRELELAEQKAQRERAEEVLAGGALESTFEEAAWRQIYRKFPNARPENLRREKALKNSIPGLVSAMKRAYIRTGRLPGGPDPIKSIELMTP